MGQRTIRLILWRMREKIEAVIRTTKWHYPDFYSIQFYLYSHFYHIIPFVKHIIVHILRLCQCYERIQICYFKDCTSYYRMSNLNQWNLHFICTFSSSEEKLQCTKQFLKQKASLRRSFRLLWIRFCVFKKRFLCTENLQWIVSLLKWALLLKSHTNSDITICQVRSPLNVAQIHKFRLTSRCLDLEQNNRTELSCCVVLMWHGSALLSG